MEPAILQGLQKAADLFREDCARGSIIGFQIEGLSSEPLVIDVTPDGVTWLARISCGSRVFLDSAVDPEAFLQNIYVVLVFVVRALRAPAQAKLASAAN